MAALCYRRWIDSYSTPNKDEKRYCSEHMYLFFVPCACGEKVGSYGTNHG